MNDPPGVPSALGIEAVEWVAEGGENLTVRVTGRWRRRRPAWSGQPMLVIETSGRRYRFPAMAEPPSLTGTSPGMWRISFTVPAALAPELGVRAWLQFGSVAVPLPSAVEFPGPEVSEGEEATERQGEAEGEDAPAPPPAASHFVADARAATEHPRQSSELESESIRRRAEEAESALSELTKLVQHLESELAQARTRAQELAASLAAQQTRRRAAEQREHAEQALRLDLARQLAARAKESDRAQEVLGQLAAAEDRVRELEDELSAAKRRSDEAEQAAVMAAADRDRVAQQASRVRVGVGEAASPAERSRLQFEQALIASRSAASTRLLAEPTAAPARPSPSVALEPEPLVSALRRELALRASAEAGLRSRLIEAETRLAAREHLTRQATQTLAALRGELDGLRAAFEHERGARVAAERRTADLESELGGQRERSRDAYAAIGELRGTLESLRQRHEPQPGPRSASSAPAPPAPAARPASAERQTGPEPAEPVRQVEPERLNEALARLRERIAPPDREIAEGSPAETAEGSPASSVPDLTALKNTDRSWLKPAFGKLVSFDPDRAGRLLVDLLPAQRAVSDMAISYDLVLGPELTIAVTASGGAPTIRRGRSPRTSGEVDFQVRGDHAALARMLVAGPLRRRFGRRVARVRGRRGGVSALEALIGVRVDLASLHQLGVRLEPRTAMALIAALIDPAETAQQQFVLAYAPAGEAELYLLVGDGGPVRVTGVRPAGRVLVTITGPAGSLEQVVSGQRPPDATVTGEEWALALVRKWVKRAQSG